MYALHCPRAVVLWVWVHGALGEVARIGRTTREVEGTLIFAYHKLKHHRGIPVYLGQYACSPVVAFFNEEPDLIAGTEYERFIYYSREHISWE